MERTFKARRRKVQKMAGLVDYGVDSDRESNDSSNNTTTSNKAKLDESNSKSDLDEGKERVTNSKNNSKSSKSGHSKEVGHKNSSSKSKTSDHHHKHHKRSRSREKDSHSSRRRRSRSRDKKSHRHRDEKKKKRRSRSRSKTRSRSRSRSRSPTSHRRDRNAPRRTRSQEKREKKAATIARMGLDVTNVASSLAMSADDSNVNSSVPRQEPSASSLSTSAAVQAAAQRVLQNRVAVAQQATGVVLPSFYNPAAVNPMKYAEQIQKRKLLWSNKEKVEQPTTSTAKIWGATAFTQDQDGKMTAKFKRLMGIKNDTPPGEEKVQPTVAEAPESSSEVIKKQQELFASLDQQYQIARATTHTQRGLGLGFSSNSSYPR